MLNHSPLTGATELHARKLQATNVLATIARMRASGEKSEQDDKALSQGLELLDRLIKGHQPFSDARVTRQLVGEGFAFLAAARALKFDQKDKFGECEISLNEIRTTLAAIRDGKTTAGETAKTLETFLSEFANVIQADINSGRAQRHRVLI